MLAAELKHMLSFILHISELKHTFPAVCMSVGAVVAAKYLSVCAEITLLILYLKKSVRLKTEL